MRFALMDNDSDWARLSKQDKECYPPHSQFSEASYLRLYNEGVHSWLLVGADDCWIGNVQVLRMKMPAFRAMEETDDADILKRFLSIFGRRKFNYITGITVFKGKQGKGFGSLLLSFALAMYPGSHVARIWAMNQASIRLFLRHGFRIEGSEHVGEQCWTWHVLER